MELTDRKKRILMALVEEYIETAEPVGSRYLAEEAGLGCSSATIRNELAELVNRGYLIQPHTSAGRIPTSKGYRAYVNELMRTPILPQDRSDGLRQWMENELEGLTEPVQDVTRLVSQLTHYPALALKPRGRITIRRFDLIYVDPHSLILVALLCDNAVRSTFLELNGTVEESMVSELSAWVNRTFTGREELELTDEFLTRPDFPLVEYSYLLQRVGAYAREVLREETMPLAMVTGEGAQAELSERVEPGKADWLVHYLRNGGKLLPETEILSGTDSVKVLIGPENVAEELKDSSVIMTSYDAGDGTRAMIGIVGPTRMDYAVIASKLALLAETLSSRLGNGNPPKMGDDNKRIGKGDDQNRG